MSKFKIALFTAGLTSFSLIPLAKGQTLNPEWWRERGVTVEGQDIVNDYAPLNIGQLKHMAESAFAEMGELLDGGAGNEISNLIADWGQPGSSDYAIANVGQLKAVSSLFWDRLGTIGYLPPGENGYIYPWSEEIGDDSDFASANIGQLKNVFNWSARLIPNGGWPSQFPDPGENFEREEEEFKLSFVGNIVKDTNPEEWRTDANQLMTIINDDIRDNRLSDGMWAVPEHPFYSGAPVEYTLRNDEATRADFFDIYFDTPDGLNEKNKSAYRFRQRFDNLADWSNYIHEFESESTRRELQAKTGSVSQPNGFSQVNESRNFLRRDPIIGNTVRAADLTEELRSIQLGRDPRSGNVLNAPQALLKYYIEQGIANIGSRLALIPRVMIRAERRRQHLRIPIRLSANGNMGRADSFILTVDTAHVYDAETMIDYMSDSEGKRRPSALASFTEVEVEFERLQAKSQIDRAINADPSNQDLIALREAFEADQERIVSIIKDLFPDGGDVTIVPGLKSKFAQAASLQSAKKGVTSSLVVSRLNYNPPGDDATGAEFIAFVNVTDEDINLRDYDLKNGVRFDFSNVDAANLTLSPGEEVFVVRNVNSFRNTYGSQINVVGAYGGGLSNGGDTVQMVDGDGFETVNFRYDDQIPWSTQADGRSSYLQVIDPFSKPDLSNSASWKIVPHNTLPPL